MPTRPTPTLQIRVIGSADHARVLAAELAERAGKLLGPGTQCRTQTRTARRSGYVRVYLTITRKEIHDDNTH